MWRALACSLFTCSRPMLTVTPCARSHLVQAIASSRDSGCLSRVIVPRFHPWLRASLCGRLILRAYGCSADSVRAMASSVLTGTFAAHDCASVSNNVTDSRELGLALGACANDIVPTPARKVVRMIFEIRIRNYSPQEREDGKVEPNWPRWTAESP